MSFCVINCTNQFTNVSGITFLDFLKVNRSRPLGSMQFVQRSRCQSESSRVYPTRQRFLALSSQQETRGTSARNPTISHRACANYVSICHTKRHFLSVKLNVTFISQEQLATTLKQKNFSISTTSVSSANLSPKTWMDAH